jgi:hypothetical protein
MSMSMSTRGRKRAERRRDLDDVPVSGAPQASFDALLEASLASASDPRAATPASPSTGPKPLPPQDAYGVTMSASQEKTPPANASSAAPRPFLRRGDRQRKIADDAKGETRRRVCLRAQCSAFVDATGGGRLRGEILARHLEIRAEERF